jgi:phage terminase large subunit-like protein
VKDQEIPINMPVNNPDEFFRGNVFIGGQGAGKDTAIQNWVVNANYKSWD